MAVERLTKLSYPDKAGFVCLMILGLLLAGVKPAQAQFQRSSRVDSTVTNQVDGTFLYEFEVFNTSDFADNDDGGPFLVDWELPLFSLNDINLGTVESPEDWTYEIVELDGTIVESPDSALIGTESQFFNNNSSPYGFYDWDYVAASDPLLDPLQGGNPDLYGPNPEEFETPPLVLHWYTLNEEDDDDGGPGSGSPLEPIFPQDSLDEFSFVSDFSSQNAPYLSSWFELPPVTGDPPTPGGGAPFGTPNSPARQQAQSATTTSIPEAGSIIGLLAFGTCGIISGLKKKAKKKSNLLT